MSTSFETHGDLAARPAARAGAGRSVVAPRPPGHHERPSGHERHPFSALPLGWAVIGRCRCGTGGPGPHASGCYALAHPHIGVALIDIAPNATPNAEARLRRALAASDFAADFPGALPVVHERVDATALRSLGWVLERGFAALPALTVPGGMAWIDRIRRAMAADSAWELPGQPKAAPDAPPLPRGGAGPCEADAADRPARRWGRAAALPLAFAGTFAVGIVAGFLLLDTRTPGAPPAAPVVAASPEQPPPPASTATAAPDGTAAAAAASTAAAVPAEPPAEAPRQETAAAASPAAPAPAAAPAAGTVIPAALPAPSGAPATQSAAARTSGSAPETQAAPAPADAAPVQRAAVPGRGAPASNGSAAPPPSLETRLSNAAPARADALPAAPPRAPAPPPVRVSAAATQQPSRSAPSVDRACTQALFRFQQGERLTAAEQNFVRTGCAASRR